jgi:hypothetical protein
LICDAENQALDLDSLQNAKRGKFTMSSNATTMRGWSTCTDCLEKPSIKRQRNGASLMTKRYKLLPKLIPMAGGKFIQAFEMGLVEFSCLGETRFDIAGYPHASEMDAIAEDWGQLGKDLRKAAAKLEEEASSTPIKRKDEGT